MIDDDTLEEWLSNVLSKNPPPLTRKNKMIHFNGITMEQTSPLTVVIKVSAPNDIHFSYDRYLLNKFYEAFPYEGVPVKIVYRHSFKKPKKG